MPAGRDKTGLDRAAWENLDPHTAIAQRRETTTGVEARSRNNNRSYLEAASPRAESTTPQNTQTDFHCLTALTTRGKDENRRAFLTKITNGIGVEPEEATVVGKTDTQMIKQEGSLKVKKEEDADVSKAEAGSAAILFDKPLFHVLTVILRLKLDNQYSYIREYLQLRKCEYWEDLENHILGEYAAIEDPDTGKIHKFPDRDYKLFSKLERFMHHINNDEPLTWTLPMWRSWQIGADVSTVGIPTTVGEQSGTMIEIRQTGNDASSIGLNSPSKIAALKLKKREMEKLVSPPKMKSVVPTMRGLDPDGIIASANITSPVTAGMNAMQPPTFSAPTPAPSATFLALAPASAPTLTPFLASAPTLAPALTPFLASAPALAPALTPFLASAPASAPASTPVPASGGPPLTTGGATFALVQAPSPRGPGPPAPAPAPISGGPGQAQLQSFHDIDSDAMTAWRKKTRRPVETD